MTKAVEECNAAEAELKLLRIEMTRLKNEAKEELTELKSELQFTINDLATQLDALRQQNAEKTETAEAEAHRLAGAAAELKETKRLLEDATTDLTHAKTRVGERDKEIEIYKLTAENAQDALETMRKEFQDTVDKELEQKQEQFLKTDQDLKNAKKNIKELKEQLDESGKQIKQKNDQATKDKKAMAESRRETDFLHKRIQYMEEEHDKKKKFDAQRMLETEQLYRENEGLRDKLAFIQQNYDLDTLDEKIKSAKRTEEWAEQFMADLKVFFNVFEGVMQCEICHLSLKKEALTPPPVMVLPCQHFFCADCHKSKRKRIGRCSSCGVDEEKVIKNVFLIEFITSYLKFKAPLQKKMDWMRLRIDKNFAF